MNTVTDREYAELRKMMFETNAIIAQMRKINNECGKMNDEREKLRAETLKLQIEAQTFKLRHAIAAVVATVVFLAAMKALLPLL